MMSNTGIFQLTWDVIVLFFFFSEIYGMTASLKDRYIACMVLSGVGDALGYKNGEWEFCHSGEIIHQEVKKRGGVGKLHAKCKFLEHLADIADVDVYG